MKNVEATPVRPQEHQKSQTGGDVRSQLPVILLTLTVSALIFAAVFWVISQIKVNGPLYERIIRGKDLIADILPPPSYIIESYLVVLQLSTEQDPNKLKSLAERLNTLKKDFDIRYEYWKKQPLPAATRTAFLEQAHGPAVRFYAIALNEYLPARLKGEAAPDVLAKLSTAYDEHRQHINQVVELANKQNAEEEATAQNVLSYSSGILITVFVVVMTAFVYWLISSNKKIAATVDRSVKIMRRIAQGDLSSNSPSAKGADVGGLEQTAEEMRLSLASLVARVQESITKLSADLKRLVADTDSINTNTERQSDFTSSVAAAIEEMSSSMEEISRHASEAETSALNSQRLSNEGIATVEKTTTEMEQVSKVINESSKALEELGQRSVEISSLVNTIRDIADQTNLLALNAAIEAARAGESGRGFAVVADEVRKLAERTAKATGQITQTIQSVQQSTSRAISIVQDGVDRVSQGVELARQAGQSVSQLGEGANIVMRSVADISGALKEQATANSNVAQSIENIADMAHRNHNSAITTVQTVSSIENLTHALQQEAARFRLH